MSSESKTKRIDICGVGIDNLSMAEAIDRIDGLVEDRTPCYVVTPNVDHIVKYQSNDAFRSAYDGAALVLPDGAPLLWAAQFLGHSFKEKVSGSDLVPAQCPRAAQKGHKLFFLGGRPGAAEEAKRRLEERHPGLRIVGIDCPPMGFEKDPAENERILKLLHEAKPDILLVAIGTPKQEIWMHRFYRQTGVPVTIGVGATFDFIAGYVRRAPRFMQRSGFEWLWRLASEPGRLWRRYLVDDTRFFWLLLKQRLYNEA